MTEKRFELQHINDLTDQEYMRLKKVTDNGELITLGEVVDLLNEQQATIEEQNKQIEEWEFSFRTEMAHHRVAEKELQDKIREQQATIHKLQDLCGESDYENAKLRLKNKELQDKIDWLCERYGYNGDGV